jgi:hypothetical protein
MLEDQENLWFETKVYDEREEKYRIEDFEGYVPLSAIPDIRCYRLSAKLLEKKKKYPNTPLPNCGVPFEYPFVKYFRAPAYPGYWIDLSGLGLWSLNEIKKCTAFSKEYGIGRYLTHPSPPYRRPCWKLLDGYWPDIKQFNIVPNDELSRLILAAVKESKTKIVAKVYDRII